MPRITLRLWAVMAGILLIVGLAAPAAVRGAATGDVQVTFTQDGFGECEAVFNRTSSGIIHEWRQDCAPVAGEEDLHIVFRPIGLRPNPTCAVTEDGAALLSSFGPWSMTDNIGPDYTDSGGTTYHDVSGDEGDLEDIYDSSTQTYNVCFYGAPTVRISNNPVADEGDELVFEVRLSSPAWDTVEVDIETDEGFSIATPGSDYVAGSTTLTFLPGTTLQTFAVTTIDDTVDDINTGFNGEFVWAHITDARGPVNLATDFISNSSTEDLWGLGVITDDEAAPTLTLSNNPQAVEGQDLNFAVTLSHGTDYTISVVMDTEEGFSSTPDYVAKTETLVFSPGQTGKTFSVQTIDDAIPGEGPNTLGPGDIVWVHADSVTGGPVNSVDFISNTSTEDLWAIGFVVDND